MANGLMPKGTLILAMLVAAPMAYGQAAGRKAAPVTIVDGKANSGDVGAFTLSREEPAAPQKADDPITATMLQDETTDGTTTVERTTVETTDTGGSPGSAFTIDLGYYLWSDYIFRGINFSEYGTEGRERLNHQLDVTLGVDLASLFGEEAGTWGTFSFNTWFEWYAAQKSIDPVHGGQNLQEVDYNLSWSYDIEPIATTFAIGYKFYAFPNLSTINTQEWWISLEHNDAWMWKWLFPDNEDGVLNPTFFMAQDTNIASGSMWFELGISHPFEIFENFTLTPSMVTAIDHRWYHSIQGNGPGGSTGLAYTTWGLDATYDLTSLLQLPDWAGSVSISAFLYFQDALGNAEDRHGQSPGRIQDEFYGGMSLAWSWGG